MEQKLLAVFSSGLPLNVSELARELGVSRQSIYHYRRRWVQEGPAGLVPRSRRPHASPTQVAPAVEEAIVRLRKELPLDNGAQTIAYHLERDDRFAAAGLRVPSVAGIHRVLLRRGMVVPAPHKRPHAATRRFRWPRPNDAWQIDATAWALADGTDVWILDVLDDHSRVLVAARVATGPTSEAAWDAFSAGVARWGIPAHVMSDNGLCFTARLHHPGAECDFERSLRALGVRHIPSRPGHPQTCGKLERSHQTTKRWLARLAPASTVVELQDQLEGWLEYYNHRRPHRALRGTTPYECWQALGRAGPADPIPGPRRASLHTVSSGGHIGWGHYLIGVDSRLAGQRVLVVAHDLDLAIHGQPGLIRRLRVDPSRRYQPSGRRVGRTPRHT